MYLRHPYAGVQSFNIKKKALVFFGCSWLRYVGKVRAGSPANACFNLYFQPFIFIFLLTCFFLDYFICYQSKIDTDYKNAI